MTDLEMTRLCVAAMGYTIRTEHLRLLGQTTDGLWCEETNYYDPLHDDVQAMALLKTHNLLIENRPGKHVRYPGTAIAVVLQHDLNRAIVECVAKMQASKGEAK